ncbi:MAG: YbjQ family protein [Gammaproteobacteria bacterium]|nr:YbjQ family protein [Gammaproteobacteria bacterium]
MVDIIILLTLLALGYGFGRYAEGRHYRSIIQREEKLQYLVAVSTKIIPPGEQYSQSSLVCGNVVISVDFFKRFLAGLRNIVGGRVMSYESLVDRARREAILRMKQEAEALGAKLVFNVKLETSSISKGGGNSIGSVEVFAYGTALIPHS